MTFKIISVIIGTIAGRIVYDIYCAKKRTGSKKKHEERHYQSKDVKK